jgi:hypothetical protein
MSESEKVPRPVLRSAGVVLGGLAAGALIGAATASPAFAAEAAPAPADAAPAGVAAAAGPSIGEQFRSAFSAGVVNPDLRAAMIVVTEP